MKRRKLTLRILSLLLAVTMIMSNSVIVHADIMPYAPGGPYSDRDMCEPPEDIGGTLENYPERGKSDDPSDVADIVGTEWATSEHVTYDETKLGEEEASEGIAGSNKLGAHNISIPALFITVEHFNVTSDIDDTIKKYLIENPLSGDKMTDAVKFISLSTIKQNSGMYVLDVDYLKETVKNCNGYVLEDLFKNPATDIDVSTQTEAKNILLNYIVAGQVPATNDSFSYQKIADVLLAYNVGGGFTQETVTKIDAIAESGIGNNKSVPVILIYNGFLNYNPSASGKSSSWKTYADEFGVDKYKAGYNSVKEYSDAAINMATVNADEAYGSAASIAFKVAGNTNYAGIYYNKSAEVNVPDGIAGINNFQHSNKNYYSRKYLIYGSNNTGIGAQTDFTFNVRSTSGVKSNNGKFTSGSSLLDYSKACGFFEIGLGGDPKTLKCIDVASRDIWNVVLDISNTYSLPNIISNNVLAIIDSVELRSNQYNTTKDFVYTPVYDNTQVTLKLTQAEMSEIVNNQYKICLNIRPQYGPKKNLSKLYACMGIRVSVDNPRTNKLKPATPAKPTNTDANAIYRVGNMTAYSYCYWNKAGAPQSSSRSIDETEIPEVTTYDEVDGVLDLSRSNEESDGVLDLSKFNEVNESNENDIDITVQQGQRVSSKGPVSSVPWSFNFTGDAAYAEIVANEIGYVEKPKSGTTAGWAQDWSVLAGIPSTETVAVGVGGTQYQVTAAGFINTETYITREVSITMTVHDGWGDKDNEPCTLHDGNHNYSHTHSEWSEGCALNNDTVKELPCAHCGKLNTITVAPCYKEKVYNGPTDHVGHWEEHHLEEKIECNCGDGSFSYECSTKEDCSYDGTITGYLKTGPTLHDNQGWNATWHWECHPDNGRTCQMQPSCDDGCESGLIDEGYTYINTYGNHCEGKWNMEHAKSATVSYEYTEIIPTASFKEITSAKVYALGYSEISEVDKTLYNASYEGNSAGNSNVQGTMWRGAGGLVEGANDIEKGGHLWYTQFVNGTYSQSGAWATTIAEGDLYFLQDCTVIGDIVCDSRWDGSGHDKEAYDTFIGNENYIKSYGRENHEYHEEHVGSSSNQWVGGHLKTGSLCESETSLKLIVVDAMNAWLCTNAGYYKANIISDFMVVGESQGNNMQDCFQNVIADFHAVDVDEGIALYGIEDTEYWRCTRNTPCPFRIDKDKVTHRCKEDQVDGLLSGAYSMATGYEPLVAGYIGITDYSNIEEKYRAKGEKGTDYISVMETCFPFFYWDRFALAAVDPKNPVIPSSGGIKLSCGDTITPPRYGMPPYSRYVWPSIDDYDSYRPVWDDDKLTWQSDYNVDGRYKYDIGNGIAWTASDTSNTGNTGGGYNHSVWSGWTDFHLVINGRRDQDYTRGIKPEEATGYYRKHHYNYVGEGMYLMSYSNCCPFGTWYKTWHPNINNHGMLTSYAYDYTFWGTNKTISGSYYVLALTHSAIDLNNRAPNGVYNASMTVTNNYVPIMWFDTPGILSGTYNTCEEITNTKIPCKFSDAYTNTAGNDNVINDVVIHDPISVESCQVIGNNYGAYTKWMEEQKGKDSRIYQKEDGTWYQKKEADKDNYAVVGNEFHVWVTDFGDFYDSSGTWANSSATLARGVGRDVERVDVSDWETGQRKEYSGNSNYRGYQDSMDTNTWIWDRLISFNFPVSYINREGKIVAVGANTFINLDDVPAITNSGSTGYVSKRYRDGYPVNDTGQNSVLGGDLFHCGSPELQSARGDDLIFTYGLDYAFTVLPSALETDDGEVTVWARSINTTSKQSEMNPKVKAKQTINLNRDENYKADDVVSKTMEIDIVGCIGNLVMTDCGDFRYSNLFKRATGDWLIQGVIQKVNLSNPKTILSTKYDILGNDCTKDGFNHGTLSATNWLFNNGINGGKSADYIKNVDTNIDTGSGTVWNYLPLVSSMNPIEEYQKDQMRMGYLAYMDIETIGNYYGYNFKHGSNIDGIEEVDRGPIAPGEEDNRKYVMTILPKYFLYDYKDQSWTGVNIYSGNSGKREIFYKNGEYVEDKNAAALYIDLTNDKTNVNSERDRRCVTKAEQILTRIVTTKAIGNGNLSVSHSALESEDYIGTSSRIILDQFDRTFIGTSFKYNAVVDNGDSLVHVNGSALGHMFNAIEDFSGNTWYLKENNTALHERVNDLAFTEQSQRWYFSIGLPSSAYLTYPSAGPTQYDIEQSHDQLMKDHPHSVVITFLDIKVQGDPWTLQYSAIDSSQGPITFDLFNPDNLPDDWEDTWDQTVTIDPKDPPEGIDPKWPPVIVYDKELTSATDWSTQGTH